jgi:hypothetical protein
MLLIRGRLKDRNPTPWPTSALLIFQASTGTWGKPARLVVECYYGYLGNEGGILDRDRLIDEIGPTQSALILHRPIPFYNEEVGQPTAVRNLLRILTRGRTAGYMTGLQRC